MRYFRATFEKFVATWGASSGPDAPYDVSGPLNVVWAQAKSREGVTRDFKKRFGGQKFKLREYSESNFRKAAMDGVILICV